MCQDCNCSVIDDISIHHHEHHHDDHHHHGHHIHINVHESILLKNDQIAQQNRDFFKDKGIFVLNVLSSPGAGKTALLERTLTDLKHKYNVSAIVGDLATDNDAIRLGNSGAPVIQINTGQGCHLEAMMIAKATNKLNLNKVNLLIIENVGNLVCPAAYDLGESLRVVLFSVTEGEDKPLKYPTIFKSADLVIITKIDLAEVVEFEREKALMNIKKVAPGANILEVSAKRGIGLENWYEYLSKHINQYKIIPVGFV